MSTFTFTKISGWEAWNIMRDDQKIGQVTYRGKAGAYSASSLITGHREVKDTFDDAYRVVIEESDKPKTTIDVQCRGAGWADIHRQNKIERESNG